MRLAAKGSDTDSPSRSGRGALRRALILLALLALPLPASADDGEGEGFILIHADDGTPQTSQQRDATARLLLEGADADPARYEYAADWAAQGRRIVTVPAASCPSGSPIFDQEGFAKALERASVDAEFGKYDRAAKSLDALIAQLGCIRGEPEAEQFYGLWFLRGAVAYSQAATGEARRYLARAAMVPGNFPFDESWPPALQELLAEAKEELLGRPTAPLLVVHSTATVRLNGAVLAAEADRVILPLRAGIHVVQIEVDGEEQTTVLDMEGMPLRPEVPAFVYVDGPGLRRMLDALSGEDDVNAQAGRAVLLAEAASRKAPWGIVVVTRSGLPADTSRVFRVDTLNRDVDAFSGAPATSDRFSRRLRLGFAFELRAQSLGAPDETAVYGGGSITVWGSLAPAVRVGGGVTIVGTARDAPAGSSSCCLLPSVQTRLRVEFPKGLVRPYGEGAVSLLWPDGVPDVVTFGAEGGGGVLLVPGAARRVGVGVGVLAGSVARIGGYLKLRVGAEVRF